MDAVTQEAHEIIGAAAWVVRGTGRYYMVTEAGDVRTAAMCIVAAWGRADVVGWMNSLGRRKWHDVYLECYLQAAPERLRHGGAMEALARGMPHGADYSAALARSAADGMLPGGATASALRESRARHARLDQIAGDVRLGELPRGGAQRPRRAAARERSGGHRALPADGDRRAAGGPAPRRDGDPTPRRWLARALVEARARLSKTRAQPADAEARLAVTEMQLARLAEFDEERLAKARLTELRLTEAGSQP